MKAFYWRTAPSGTEGVTSVYVSSNFGSDDYGNGTRQKPYKMIGRAWRYSSTKPSLIICDGRFCESMADGNHVCSIVGDYFGAATFDGADTYVIYGFTHANLIITNCGVGSADLIVWSGSGAFAGCGRAYDAGLVGVASNVCGVAGSPVIVHESPLYWGVIGGTTAVTKCIFSKPKCNDTYKVSLGSQSTGALISNTIYGCRIVNRQKRLTSYIPTWKDSIFSDFDLFADDKHTYDRCLFTADCKWYFGLNEIVLTGVTPAERQASLTSGMDALSIAAALRPIFIDCKFSLQTAEAVFNDAENCDFTLKPDGDGVWQNQYLEEMYYGAMEPAINVPIKTNSDGIAACWDARSSSGLIVVENDNICIDEASTAFAGEIYTKILKVDPESNILRSIWSLFADKFRDFGTYLLNESLTGLEYFAGNMLPIGHYIVRGSVEYNYVNVYDGDIVIVSVENTTFADQFGYTSTLTSVVDATMKRVCYMRTQPAVYAKITQADTIQTGGVYLNSGLDNITYRGRTIIPNESFIAENNTDKFTHATNPVYEIGVMFDDNRVPVSDWYPLQLFGEIFVGKISGIVKYDTDNIPVSSGNPLAYQTSANGGYSNLIFKDVFRHRYIQFKLSAKRYGLT